MSVVREFSWVSEEVDMQYFSQQSEHGSPDSQYNYLIDYLPVPRRFGLFPICAFEYAGIPNTVSNAEQQKLHEKVFSVHDHF